MADAKKKINLLDVVSFRSENIIVEKGSDATIISALSWFK